MDGPLEGLARFGWPPVEPPWGSLLLGAAVWLALIAAIGVIDGLLCARGAQRVLWARSEQRTHARPRAERTRS